MQKENKCCNECAHMKHIVGMDNDMGICSWFNVVKSKYVPIDCLKWIREPSKDEKAMEILSTVIGVKKNNNIAIFNSSGKITGYISNDSK